MTKPRRYVPLSTTKILFALTGNQCAYPCCDVTIVEPGTRESGPVTIGEICHIYALSSDGPRGKSGLTETELNSPDNLIVLCPNHHAVVDRQHETYPAELLKQWKRKHEAKVSWSLRAKSEKAQQDVFFDRSFPTALVDQKIGEKTDILRKSRFLVGFDKIRFYTTLREKPDRRRPVGGY